MKGSKSLIALIVTWVVVVLIGGLYYSLYRGSKDINEIKISKKEESLDKEKIHYFKTRDKAYAIAKEIFPDVEISNIYIRDDVMYLDCSDDILKLKEPTRDNILAIYSLVNRITEMPNIKKVKILVNGKEETGNFSRMYLRKTNI